MTTRDISPLRRPPPFAYAIPMTQCPNPDDGRTPSYGGGSIWPHFGLILPYFGLETPPFSAPLRPVRCRSAGVNGAK